MDVLKLQQQTRRLLQETAVVLASAPVDDNGNGNSDNVNSIDFNTHFSPSMAIILVVLLTALFFMAFFSIYVKRCTTRSSLSLTASPLTNPAPAAAAPQGVDAAFLQSLPLVSYTASTKKKGSIECVVCLTEFDDGEPLRQLPRCKHVFHKDCIDMWLFSHTTCPLCRCNVISDGTRSFRWGGSGSLRLSLGGRRRGNESGRGSTTGPSTPIEGQGSVPQVANLDEIQRKTLRRSHSTGHSFLKQAQSGAVRAGTPSFNDVEEAQPSTGCFPLTPPAAYQRSRSVVFMRGDAPPQNSVSSWMREAGASLKRALSLKRVSPAAEAPSSAANASDAAASSSSSRSAV